MKLMALWQGLLVLKAFKTQNSRSMRCHVEDVCRRMLIFLKSAERQGGANRTFKASGRCHGWQPEQCPYGLESLYHFSIENSRTETRHQGVMFRSPRAFVALRQPYVTEPCTCHKCVAKGASTFIGILRNELLYSARLPKQKRRQSYYRGGSPHHGIR